MTAGRSYLRPAGVLRLCGLLSRGGYRDRPVDPYTCTVKARDQSVATNTTKTSAGVSVATLAADTSAPEPSPMTFATNPTAVSSFAITMTISRGTETVASPVQPAKPCTGTPSIPPTTNSFNASSNACERQDST